MKFQNVTAEATANIYYDGKIVSHKVTLADETTKTLGVMFTGEYHLDTDQAERMDITQGTCTVIIDGTDESTAYSAGQHFNFGATSGFKINVASDTYQYVCSYIH